MECVQRKVNAFSLSKKGATKNAPTRAARESSRYRLLAHVQVNTDARYLAVHNDVYHLCKRSEPHNGVTTDRASRNLWASPQFCAGVAENVAASW